MKAKGGKRTERGFGFDSYLSPFTWRYGSPEMRDLFSEVGKRARWRKVWLALAEGEHKLGLVTKAELDGIRSKAGREDVDVEAAQELEKTIRHDLMAELRTFAAQAGKGGGKLHLGATSMDIEDNADALIFLEAIGIIKSKLVGCLAESRKLVLKYKDTVCMGWTHLQPAEPTTLGYRIANYAQDLVTDVEFLDAVKGFVLGKGVKGAVGTSASFKALLGSDARVRELEDDVMIRLRLHAFEVSSQTYPRKVDFLILSALASIAQSCHKFGLDLRVMQSPAFGELSEPYGKLQVGSSAMPFKRNPVTAERMCSLARVAATAPLVAFTYASNSILERTLDDSAARRIVIPEAFLAVDECLTIYESLVRGLCVYPVMMERNLERFGPFAGTEAVMMKLAEKGMDRQEMHELLRNRSNEAWGEVMAGRPNPLLSILSEDRTISSKLSGAEVRRLLDPRGHVGDASERCESFVRKKVDPILARHARTGKHSR